MKKNILYSLLVLLFCNAALAAIDIPTQFCGEAFTEKMLLSNWRKEGEKYCAKASCKNETSSLERQRCVYQGEHPNTILMTQQDQFQGPNLSQYKGKLFDFILAEGENCYNECLPVQTTSFMGLKKKMIHGVERESCRICFVETMNLVADGSYINPVTNKIVYEGQKCHHPCKNVKGDFGKRIISPECVACTEEKFEHVLTKKNNCFELDMEKGSRLVPTHLCKNDPEVSLTRYQEGSSFTLSSLIFGTKPDCLEVDEKSNGYFFKVTVDRSKCERNNGIVDSDRSNGKNVDSKNKSNTSATGKATHQ